MLNLIMFCFIIYKKCSTIRTALKQEKLSSCKDFEKVNVEKEWKECFQRTIPNISGYVLKCNYDALKKIR